MKFLVLLVVFTLLNVGYAERGGRGGGGGARFGGGGHPGHGGGVGHGGGFGRGNGFHNYRPGFNPNYPNSYYFQGVRGHYNQNYYANCQRLGGYYGGYYRNGYYRNYWGPWNRWGFYGGWYYPFLPVYNIVDYFYYPMVFWLYANAYYYSTFAPYYVQVYGQQAPQAFAHANAFFPTEEMTALGIEVSNVNSVVLRQNYQQAIVKFTNQLKEQIGKNTNTNFKFESQNIVMNHYTGIKYNGVVLEGFVKQGKVDAVFKAVLDLTQPDRTLTFVPKNQKPSDEEIKDLEALNQRVRELSR